LSKKVLEELLGWGGFRRARQPAHFFRGLMRKVKIDFEANFFYLVQEIKNHCWW
jgi:hypothetical protein